MRLVLPQADAAGDQSLRAYGRKRAVPAYLAMAFAYSVSSVVRPQTKSRTASSLPIKSELMMMRSNGAAICPDRSVVAREIDFTLVGNWTTMKCYAPRFPA